MSDNPYAAPSAPIASPKNEAVYTKELKSARNILIVVGIIQLLFGAFFISQARKNFDEQVAAEVKGMGADYTVDKDKLEEAWGEQKSMIYALYGVPLALGVFFLVMAMLVYRMPVGVTLTSLIVFIVAHVGDAVFEPAALLKGIILKVIFLMVLWKAWKSAKLAVAAREAG